MTHKSFFTDLPPLKEIYRIERRFRYDKIIDKHRLDFCKRNPGYLRVLVNNDFLSVDCSKIMLPRLADYNFRIWRNSTWHHVESTCPEATPKIPE